MDQEQKSKSWWQTLPGLITAVAGIITAVAGLVVALNQAGFFERRVIPPGQPAGVLEPLAKQTSSGPAGSASVGASGPPQQSAEPTVVAQAQPQPSRKINLLAPENGGHIVLASSDDWQGTIDGKENQFQISYGIGKDAVYGFKDDRLAAFDTFAMLINGTEDWNIKEFELLISRDSPSGPFDSIGKFKTQNLKIFATPYQVFRFQPVKAKFLKFRLISTYGWPHPNAFEFQLLGSLE